MQAREVDGSDRSSSGVNKLDASDSRTSGAPNRVFACDQVNDPTWDYPDIISPWVLFSKLCVVDVMHGKTQLKTTDLNFSEAIECLICKRRQRIVCMKNLASFAPLE